jgi:hypothetical protein
MTDTTVIHAGPAAPATPAPSPAPAHSGPHSVTPAPGEIIDSLGRRLKLREISLLQELDLMAAVGDAKSMNRPWMFNCLLSCRVAEIDGNPVPFPSNEVGLRGAVQRVGREGVAAVLAYLNRDDAQDATAADENASKN